MKVYKARKTLITSMVAIIISFSILIGYTFAWFTDSSTSGINTIQSGNLDVALVYTNSYTGDPVEVDEDTKLFMDINGDPILWEPGAFASGRFEVKNDGMLALKYSLSIIQANATETPNGKTLADALSVYAITRNKVTGTDNVMADANLEALQIDAAVPAYDPMNMPSFKDGFAVEAYLLPGESITYEIGIYWQPTATDNEFNVPGGLSIDFAVALLATQVSYENDGDGNFYDSNANYPEAPSIPEREQIVGEGASSGIYWTLTSEGKLTVSPAETSVPDKNCGKVFAPGVWREAVVYNSKGSPVVEGYKTDKPADEGGYFCDRSLVTSLVIEEGVTSIGTFAAQFPNLTGEVVIPASVTYIGQEAFQGCPITKLTFAPGGTEALCIAPGAFKQLGIEEIVFPADRPEIHLHCWALNNCKKLKNVTFTSNITTFSKWTHVDYMGLSYSQNSDSQIFSGCTALESITFTSQAVHDLFFAAAGNTKNINAIGNVQIIINK